MKTFANFLLEAELKWNTGTLRGSGKSPSDTAKQKEAQLKRDAKQKPSPEVFSRLTKIKKGITGADTLAKDTDPKPESTATRMQRTGRVRTNTGRATFKDTPTSSVGTVSGVRRRGLEPSDTRISGRYGTVPGGRGTGVSRSGGQIGR
jgi:hypothetical protein